MVLVLSIHSLKADVIQASLGDHAGRPLHGPANVSGSFWNDWLSQEAILKNSDGVPTNVTFTSGGEGPHGDWWCDLELLSAGVHVQAEEHASLVISGLLPLASYDLYIASAYGNQASRTSFTTNQPTNSPSTQTAHSTGSTGATNWTLGGNFVFFQDIQADSSGQISINYQGSGSYGILNGFQLIGPQEQPTTTFQAWVANPENGLATSEENGPLDDPDLDGIVNLMEFALAGSPVLSSTAVLPKLRFANGEWFFSYHRSDASRPPFTTQVVEYSRDLLDWTPMIVPVTSDLLTIISDDGATDHVEVKLPVTGGQCFARLKVAHEAFPQKTFLTWASEPENGLATSEENGPLDDPDLDGIVNLMEFALGGSPMLSSTAVLPMLSFSAGVWTFSYQRGDASRPPFTYQIVEYSSDLLNWTPIVVPLTSSAAVSISDNGATDRVVVRLPITEGPCFARLKVAQ